MSACGLKLVVDTRERNVLRHSVEFGAITYEVAQITVGDYVLLYGTKIIAAFERKSLCDYAASITDGRHLNKAKLIGLREETGCQLFYIVEGPEFPAPTDVYSNMPYRYIESSMFHLQMRDNIHIIRTANTLDTAKMLVRFMASTVRLLAATGPTLTDTVVSTCTPEHATGGDDTALLTKKYPIADIDVVRKMWSCFPGIGAETADEFMHDWSISDIVCGVATRAQIVAKKMATGKSVNKKVINSLTCCTATHIKLLSAIPGMSRASAAFVLNDTSLGAILMLDVAAIALLARTPKTKVGPALAATILRLFQYRLPATA